MPDLPASDVLEAVATFATGVVVATVRDGRDDIGTTLTGFASVSAEPPMVSAAVIATSYLSEVMHRCDRWAVTVLSAGQRAVAGRFAAAGRPSARLLVAGTPHHRGPRSDALVIEGGLAAMECETRLRAPVGDHVLFVAEVLSVEYADPSQQPLIRFNRRYR